MLEKQVNTDYLIIGQGLAGTHLSYQLYKRGIDHVVVDEVRHDSASRVAAGIINPIGVKRMVKSWNIDAFLPFARATYEEIGTLIKQRIFYPLPILKIYSENCRNFWQHRLEKGQLEDYVTVNDNCRHLLAGIKAPHGFGVIEQGGRVDLPAMLDGYRQFLLTKDALVNEAFQEQDLIVHNDAIQWRHIKAKKIIFCRGVADSESEFFKELDFRHTKGELLDVTIDNLDIDGVVMKNIFVLPISDKAFKIGATFAHQWDDLSPTKEKLDELEEKWKVISDLPFKVQNHLVGIRPTMHDRRPVMGYLKKHPCIGVFNGLGSRGGVLAPLLASHWADSISALTPKSYREVLVDRYNA